MLKGTLALASAIAAVTLPVAASEHVLRIDPDGTAVTFVLEATAHDVEGTLVVVSGEIRFDPETGAASGQIVVDAKRADTGNARRDRKMHDDVLETARYPLFVFRPSSFSGAYAESGRSDVELGGTMSIHGEDHPMNLAATVTVDGGRLSGRAEFSIPYVDWGMEDPSWFVLRVAKQVRVRVEIRGTVTRDTTGRAESPPAPHSSSS